MLRSRGSLEAPKGNSPRLPIHLKTTVCSEANGITRHSVDRSSPKLSPCSPLHEKKRGTRVAELEAKLTQTKEEVKKLKEKLALSEAAKKTAQQELELTKKLIPVPVEPKQEEEEPDTNIEEEEEEEESIASPATDVFEVMDPNELSQADEADTKTMIEAAPNGSSNEEEIPKGKEEDTLELNAKLGKIEKEINMLAEENEALKKRVEEASEASKAKEEELKAQMMKLEEELGASRKKTERLEQKVEEAEGAKEAMEMEMKKLKVQTEQWRKAAETAAAVLSGGEERFRIGERCGSMEKNAGMGFVGSPGMGGEFEEKKRGMKMFGELWKKRGQK